MRKASTRGRPSVGKWLSIAAVLAATGCDVYDEPVRPVADREAVPGWNGLAEGQRPFAIGRPAGIEFVEGYPSAVARAELERKPLLVLFRASWCRWCVEMTAKVLSEQQVVQRSRRFICVAVDADRDPDICRTHGVRGYPTILVISPDGREIVRRTGKVALKTLVAMLDDVHSAAASVAAPATKTVR